MKKLFLALFLSAFCLVTFGHNAEASLIGKNVKKVQTTVKNTKKTVKEVKETGDEIKKTSDEVKKTGDHIKRLFK